MYVGSALVHKFSGNNEKMFSIIAFNYELSSCQKSLDISDFINFYEVNILDRFGNVKHTAEKNPFNEKLVSFLDNHYSLMYLYDYRLSESYWIIRENDDLHMIKKIEAAISELQQDTEFFLLGDIEICSHENGLNKISTLKTFYTGAPIDLYHKLIDTPGFSMCIFFDYDIPYIVQLPSSKDSSLNNTDKWIVIHRLENTNLLTEIHYFTDMKIDLQSKKDDIFAITAKIFNLLNQFNILTEARESLDSIDRELIQLLNKRCQIVRNIGIIKKQYNIPILQKSRVKKMLEKRQEYLKENTELSIEFIHNLFNLIVNYSMELEEKI